MGEKMALMVSSMEKKEEENKIPVGETRLDSEGKGYFHVFTEDEIAEKKKELGIPTEIKVEKVEEKPKRKKKKKLW